MKAFLRKEKSRGESDEEDKFCTTSFLANQIDLMNKMKIRLTWKIPLQVYIYLI